GEDLRASGVRAEVDDSSAGRGRYGVTRSVLLLDGDRTDSGTARGGTGQRCRSEDELGRRTDGCDGDISARGAGGGPRPEDRRDGVLVGAARDTGVRAGCAGDQVLRREARAAGCHGGTARLLRPLNVVAV